MPRITDVKKVLVIGSGSIVIGQAAEFDYSGSQACKALREEGFEVVLVNSNPATIQTDADFADKVYIEPLKPEFLERIIEKERPQGLIGTMGGQTGLNLTVKLAEMGVLEKFGVRVLGTGLKAIDVSEDRGKFAEFMKQISEPVVPSVAANSLEEAKEFVKTHNYPVIIRSAFTLGGSGSGIAHNDAELEEIVSTGLRMSAIHQVLVEESIYGLGEFEYEVMRDAKGNCITVCNMENFDPTGIHTGESIVVAPSQTLSDDDHQMLRSAALKIIRALGIEGGCNVQFALDQKTGKYFVIEVNPRLSRSSALASKATGYPIARVAAKIAVGYSLDELENAVTKTTPASFEPALDYVVVKIPRWPFDKLPEAGRILGTQMKSTGEVMAIGRSFEEALGKAIRSLEIKKCGLGVNTNHNWKDRKHVMEFVEKPTNKRLYDIYAALKLGVSPEEISRVSHINQWFIEKMKLVLEKEIALENAGKDALSDAELIRGVKTAGFSDKQISQIIGVDMSEVRKARKALGILPAYKMVDTCAAEFEAVTPYYYSTWESENEAIPEKRKKIVVLGSGPIRIGQGIEFDYCCCHAAFALKQAGVQSIMVNNNPETISTDFDTSDRLYFEPLTAEDVLNVIENEKPDGVIVQFGGQTSINLAKPLHDAGVRILGTGMDGIDIAEDRERFRELMKTLGIPQPENGTARNAKEALAVAQEIGYPIIVRPSYVIAGHGMRVVYDDAEMLEFIAKAVEVSEEKPVLIDRYLENAIECEIDGVSDEHRLFIAGIMEHVEKAGVHSGDASCVVPPIRLSEELINTIIDYSNRISRAIKNIGAINIQFAVQAGKVYIIEANPRASRTMPFLSKVTGIPIVKVATNVMLGATLDELGIPNGIPKQNFFAVKSPVFPFIKLPGTDFSLEPEMKSTGESMGIDLDFGHAYYKAMLGANMNIPMKGNVVLSLGPSERSNMPEIARGFSELGFQLFATDGTAAAANHVAPIEVVKKVSEGSPNIVEMIYAGKLDMVVITPTRDKRAYLDGFKIRRAAIECGVPVIATVESARGVLIAINAARKTAFNVAPLSEYYKRNAENKRSEK